MIKEIVHKAERPWLGILLIVLALQILPVSDAIAKYVSQALPIIQVIWARFFFHCVLTGIYCGSKYGIASLIPSPKSVLFARGAALFAAVSLFYITVHYLPMTTTLTLWFVEPFILTIMAVAFFREEVSAVGWCAVALGFVGILFAIRPDVIEFHFSYLAGLAAGVAYAVFLLLSRAIDENSPPLVSVYHTGLVGCAASSAFMPFVWVPPSHSQWALLTGIGAVAACAHFFVVRAFAEAKASTLAPFTYTEIFAATILGYVIFDNVPSVSTVLGLVLIAFSGILIAVRTQPVKPAEKALAGDAE